MFGSPVWSTKIIVFSDLWAMEGIFGDDSAHTEVLP